MGSARSNDSKISDLSHFTHENSITSIDSRKSVAIAQSDVRKIDQIKEGLSSFKSKNVASSDAVASGRENDNSSQGNGSRESRKNSDVVITAIVEPVTLPTIGGATHSGQSVERWEKLGSHGSDGVRSLGSDASSGSHTTRSNHSTSNRSANIQSKNGYASRLSNFLNATNDEGSRSYRSHYSDGEYSGGRSLDTYTQSSYTDDRSYTSYTGTLSDSVTDRTLTNLRTHTPRTQSTTVPDSYANPESTIHSPDIDQTYVIENAGGRIDLQQQRQVNSNQDDETATASMSKKSVDDISVINGLDDANENQ